jgi:hypothetical protein
MQMSEHDEDRPGTGVDDQVLVRSAGKIAHEDLAATQKQIDDENTETRDGKDFEGQPAQAEINEELKQERGYNRVKGDGSQAEPKEFNTGE